MEKNENKYNMEIRRKLKAKRILLGLTLKELSELSGVPSTRIQKTEIASQHMDMDSFFKLAKALGITVDFHLDDTEV